MMRTIGRPHLADFNAALLVALVGIPQCLAYAMLAGLPPMYGLVTAAIPGLIAALLGKSPALTVGPTNTTGLIILTALIPWANQPDALLTAMATLAFLAGLSRLVIVLLKAERLFDFVPEAVMVGFATGAAVIIALMQIDELLGPPFEGVRNVVDEVRMLSHFKSSALDVPSLVLGSLALVVVVLGHKFAPRWPIPLFVVVVSMAWVWFDLADFSHAWVTVGDSSVVADGWPVFNHRLPSWHMIQTLIVPGFAVAFIGSLELIVTLRNRQEHRLLRRELGSQGYANMIGSFIGAFPASTSLTRSVLLDLGGARTRWAPFLAALMLIPIILYGAAAVRSIPLPVISGLLIATALSMLKPAAIKQMLTVNNQTRILFLVTLISTLVLTFHEAILLGSMLGIMLFLFQTSQTQLTPFVVDANGGLSTPSDRDAPSQPRLIQISGSLYFAAARQLPERLNELLNDTHHLVLDLSHAHHCRVAAVQALLAFLAECTLRGVVVEVSGASAELKLLTQQMGVRLPWSEKRLAQTLVTSNVPETSG
jgi:SulP family sulfate permease